MARPRGGTEPRTPEGLAWLVRAHTKHGDRGAATRARHRYVRAVIIRTRILFAVGWLREVPAGRAESAVGAGGGGPCADAAPLLGASGEKPGQALMRRPRVGACLGGGTGHRGEGRAWAVRGAGAPGAARAEGGARGRAGTTGDAGSVAGGDRTGADDRAPADEPRPGRTAREARTTPHIPWHGGASVEAGRRRWAGRCSGAGGCARRTRTTPHAEPASGHLSRWWHGGASGRTGRDRGRKFGQDLHTTPATGHLYRWWCDGASGWAGRGSG